MQTGKKVKADRTPRITPQKATAWIQNKTGGKSMREIAAERGVNTSTIWRQVNDFEDFLKTSPDVKEGIPRFVSLVKPSLDAYEGVISKWRDRGYVSEAIRAATNILKGIGFIKDRQVVEQPLADAPDDELAKIEEELRKSA